jgi:hypothetical protein
LDQYQKGRFEVYLDTSGLTDSVDELARLGRQFVIAVMLVGMIIGSGITTGALAYVQPQGWYGVFVTRLAYFGFVVAMLVAVLIILRLIGRWIRGASPLRD